MGETRRYNQVVSLSIRLIQVMMKVKVKVKHGSKGGKDLHECFDYSSELKLSPCHARKTETQTCSSPFVYSP